MMIKVSQIPGVRHFKSYKDLFKHISNELTDFHSKNLSKMQVKRYNGKGAMNVNNRR